MPPKKPARKPAKKASAKKTPRKRAPKKARKPKAAPPPVASPARRWLDRLRRVVLWATVVVFVVPISQALLLNVVAPPVTLTMLGRSVRHLRAEGELRLPAYDWVDLEDIPEHVAAAALSSEDARFYEHRGFDWQAIEQALDEHRGGSGGGGGSSISQQTAKNVFLWQNRSWIRKGLEIWYTFWMETLVPKHRILEVYLNIAETGPMTFGVGAGAQRWFGAPVQDITPLQSAQLISLFPAPEDWTPQDSHVQKRARRISSWASPLPDGWRDQ